MRHARPGGKQVGMSDHDRPLGAQGEEEARRVGRLIRGERLTPDLILSSTAARARQTAEAVSEACDGTEGPRLLPSLYLAAAQDCLRQLEPLSDENETVMLVGHNPGLEALIESLTGSPETLTTAAVVQIDLPIDRWHELKRAPRGKLQRVWRPQDIRRQG
jgi:phosphohistidine phosphatase